MQEMQIGYPGWRIALVIMIQDDEKAQGLGESSVGGVTFKLN